uniref:Calponin-homology (CH) domain-containing protein n=1 Tax=Cynoglossus semilaevis TaxID=244447 RepID=A0A3P8V2E8_CYNSE
MCGVVVVEWKHSVCIVFRAVWSVTSSFHFTTVFILLVDVLSVSVPHSLVNRIRPGLIKRVNRLPTPIAGLDNLNVFLRACGRLGLKEAQLFHPGDLQDLSTRVTVKDQETDRRLKNVLITIYWLGRRAQCDSFYDGPYLNFKAFEGLLGTALYKVQSTKTSSTEHIWLKTF